MAIIDSAELLLRASTYNGSGDWLDESGNGHDATPVSSPTWDGLEFTLDGTSHFTIPDHADLNFNNADFTIIVVGSVTSTATTQVFYSKYEFVTPSGQELTLETLPTGRGRAASTDGVNIKDEAGAGSTSEMILGFRYNDTTPSLEAFLDGTGSGTPDGTALADQSNGLDVYLGRRPNGNIPLTGTIKAVGVWRSALSDADMATAGTELATAVVSSPSPLLLGVIRSPRYGITRSASR